ncbi:MAG: CinA family nicotinamide mononucleotide deamidase-related protein [Deltaproteobacteria bacterium]
MTIELVATGDELLNGTIVDTNSAWLLERLAALGLPARRTAAVRDVRADIVDALRGAAARAEVLIVSGGLGPTADDITLECAAEAAGVPLTTDELTLAAIRRRMEKRGLAFTENNARQARVPKGSRVHQNRFGTAPLVELELGRARAFLLPGVPREYQGLLEEIVLPRLAEASLGAPVRRVRVLRCYGAAESHLDHALSGFAQSQPGLEVGYRTTLPENHVRLVALGAPGEPAAEVEARLDEASREARRLLGAACFSDDGHSFSETLGGLLCARNATVALAESLTGGLCGGLLTEAAGASRYARLSLVAYSEAVKRDVLGVPERLLAAHGAVSLEVAGAMAERARALGQADYGLSCTGLAGPGTDGSGQPVGTVFTALATAQKTEVRRHAFGGERDRIRAFTSYATLDALRLHLLEASTP